MKKYGQGHNLLKYCEKCINKRMIDPIDLAAALIQRPSVTPKDEGAQQVLIDALTPLGFKFETLQFGDITNLYARLGDGAPHFCFCGHTDVVPAGDVNAWTDPPFSGIVKNGKLYGRGASDMKGEIACFVAAVSQYLANNKPKGSISLLITGDEEGIAENGTIKVLEWMAKNNQVPDVALVGEPSNAKEIGEEMRIGRRGSFKGSLTVRGKQGHTAYPERADNPLPRMVKMLDVLANFEFDKGNEFFPPTNLQLTTIDVGNTVNNVIPASVNAQMNVRFNNLWSSKTIEFKIRELLDTIDKNYELKTWCNAESFMTKPGAFTDLVSSAVNEVTGRKPVLGTGGGTSDARFVTNYCPVVEFGLLNQTIHQIDEHANVADMHKLTEIYRLVLERYFG